MGDLMNNEKALQEFATQISVAVAGGESPHWFDNDVGLCSNLSSYMDSKQIDYSDRKTLRAAFNDQIELHREYEQDQYPFNLNAHDYLRALEEGRVYKNVYRLDFIEVLKNNC